MEIRTYKVPNSDIELEVPYDGKTIRVRDRYVTQKARSGKEYTRLQKGRVLAQVNNGTGYLQVRVQHQGVVTRYYVHRLVWLVFRGEVPEGLEIDHIDNDKSNCGLDNLQLLTRKENMSKCHKNNPHIRNNLPNIKAL